MANPADMAPDDPFNFGPAPPPKPSFPQIDPDTGFPPSGQSNQAYPSGPGWAYGGSGPQAYGQPEQLPGITSGPAPKPWGLNRDQPLYQKPPYESGFIKNTLDPYRKGDPSVDPRGEQRPPDMRDPVVKGPGIVEGSGGKALGNWMLRQQGKADI